MTGIEAVKQAIAELPIEIVTGTVSREGNTLTVAEFLEQNVAPYMDGKTKEDVMIFVNTRLKKYITEAPKPEYTTIKVVKPVITHETRVIQVNKPTISFQEPEKVEEETDPFVITTKLPKISFQQLSELNEKNVRIKTFLLSDPKYSKMHKINETEQNSFRNFMELYPMELVEIENNVVTIKMGEKRVTLEEAYDKFMSPINVYEAELFEEKFQTIVGEIYDIMDAHQIDDRNKEILFKSKTKEGKTFFEYIRDNIVPMVPDTYDAPNGENLKDYLEKEMGMQIAFDNDKVNTNNKMKLIK